MLLILCQACAIGAGLRGAEPAPPTAAPAWTSRGKNSAAFAPRKDALITNAFVRLGVGFGGAWGLGTTGGDPADPDDDNLDLTFSVAGSSNGLALEIDGVLHVLDESSPEIAVAGDGASIVATWLVDGVCLQALYELVDIGSGRADTARVTYRASNPATGGRDAARTVGLKLGLDIDVANAYARLVTPAGPVATETGFGQTGNGGAYPLPVPDFWQGFQLGSLVSPGLVGQGVLAGSGATPPDKVVIGAWPEVSAGATFDYTPSGQSFGDSAVALWWFDRALSPGSSATFVVLYGMGRMDAAGTGLAMGVSGPESLGPDGSVFTPNPFSIVVQLQNLATETQVDPQVTVSLPAGLSVADGGSATQSVASLPNGGRGLVAFRLAASPDCAGQTLSYSVAVSTATAQASVVRRVRLPLAPTEPERHTVTFQPGQHGVLVGGVPAVRVTVNRGDPAPTVAVVIPEAGWSFTGWSPGLPATVTADIETTAQYSPIVHTLTYLAGDHGAVTGPTPQTVDYGGSGVAVMAEANSGYHFEHWTDGSAANPRTDANVTADLTVTAEFDINRYAVTFVAGAGGRIGGTTSQTVVHGGNGTPVVALANYGFVFSGWSDSVTTPTRTPTNVMADVTYSASFRAAGVLTPNGGFLAVVDSSAAGSDGLWDLSGAYALDAGGHPLVLNLVHDTQGKLSGSAAYTLAKDTVVTMPIKGSVKGTGGSITMKATMKGATPDKAVRASLAMNLTVDTGSRQLTGPLTGSAKSGGVTTTVNQDLALPIPPPMDGTWTLAFQLAQSGTAVTGTALLTLSSGVEHGLTAKGKTGANSTAVLSLAGAASDPSARAIKIKTTLTPLEGGWARLGTFSGKAYGQTLAW